MEAELLKAQQRAQFDSSLVMVRHTVMQCVDDELALHMYRQLMKSAEDLRKKFTLKPPK